MVNKCAKNLFLFSKKFDLEDAIKKTLRIISDSFYICNLSDVIQKYEDWQRFMPRVKPHYAVKCNDDINVLKTLASVGCSFDCATLWEIEKIISLNVSTDRIIFANTTKIASHIDYAKQQNVNLMTFDNEDEIEKIIKIYPDARLILRIRYSSEKAIYKLGRKFGSDPISEAPQLLKLAKSYNLNVVGISFHIGSSCEDYEAYGGAIKACRKLFEFGTEIGFNFKILDIGGGFFGDSFNRIRHFSSIINNALDEHFPQNEFTDLEIFSEPGRYFVESAFTLISQIHSRKVTKNTDGSILDIMYYQNEGVYSNFLFIPLGPEEIIPKVLSHKRSGKKFKTTIWGPTCDSTDKVCENIDLEMLDIGDIMYYENMGAYTIPLRTPFNAFQTTKMAYFLSEDDRSKINESYELDFHHINADFNNNL
ncbi:ornithine decarboxylase 2-like [Chironomus tepperi]|uniref:ornithine decarboxylase 2-like n=1 Tax=Chironomus tepperi TaxID=113505 RepID=UPI00391F5035